MNEDERTIPWHADEYMHVDGRRCVYTLFSSDPGMKAKVHLHNPAPGSPVPTVAELKRWGHDVELPGRWRYGG